MEDQIFNKAKDSIDKICGIKGGRNDEGVVSPIMLGGGVEEKIKQLTLLRYYIIHPWGRGTCTKATTEAIKMALTVCDMAIADLTRIKEAKDLNSALESIDKKLVELIYILQSK